MSLTYQPFAELPEIEKLGEDLRMNLSDEERFGSAALGAAMIGYGLVRNAETRWPALILGGLLLWRGHKGQCHVKQALGQDSRHRPVGAGEQAARGLEVDVQAEPSPLGGS